MTRRTAKTFERGDVVLHSVDHLEAAVESMPGAWPQDAYVVDSCETDDHPSDVFCRRHAKWTASRESKRLKCEVFVSNISWGETESSEFCAYPKCWRELNAGSLTDYGVDIALALTGTDPLKSSVTPYELKRAAWSMTDDDERWGLWILQALRVIPSRRIRKRSVTK